MLAFNEDAQPDSARKCQDVNARPRTLHRCQLDVSTWLVRIKSAQPCDSARQGLYRAIEPAEINKLPSERDRAVTIEKFVPPSEIDPMYYAAQTNYFVRISCGHDTIQSRHGVRLQLLRARFNKSPRFRDACCLRSIAHGQICMFKVL
jgi:hypothetical protein